MTSKDKRTLALAAKNREMVAVKYNKPGVGPITRHVNPHEVSVNRAGRAVVWGTDSVHGPDQLHAFRLDRVLEVRESKRPKHFEPHEEVTQHLRSFGARPSNQDRWREERNPSKGGTDKPKK